MNCQCANIMVSLGTIFSAKILLKSDCPFNLLTKLLLQWTILLAYTLTLHRQMFLQLSIIPTASFASGFSLVIISVARYLLHQSCLDERGGKEVDTTTVDSAETAIFGPISYKNLCSKVAKGSSERRNKFLVDQNIDELMEQGTFGNMLTACFKQLGKDLKMCLKSMLLPLDEETDDFQDTSSRRRRMFGGILRCVYLLFAVDFILYLLLNLYLIITQEEIVLKPWKIEPIIEMLNTIIDFVRKVATRTFGMCQPCKSVPVDVALATSLKGLDLYSKAIEVKRTYIEDAIKESTNCRKKPIGEANVKEFQRTEVEKEETKTEVRKTKDEDKQEDQKGSRIIRGLFCESKK